MTVERVEPGQGSVELAADYEGVRSKLQQFAQDAQAAYEVALVLAPTPFVPEAYKGSGSKYKNTWKWFEKERVAQTIAAAMLSGDEIGLSPMQSIQSIDVIEGRPALNALAQRALVQSHGHEVWVHERVADARGQRTQVSVTVRGKRAGSDHIAESTWSLDRARQAGLLDKTNWQNHPEAMCIARASSDVCRQIAADVLLGLAYTVEELEDEDAAAMASAGDHSVQVRPKEETPPESPAVEGAGEDRQSEPKPAEAPDTAPVEAETAEPQAEESSGEEASGEEPYCGHPKPDEPRKVCSRPFEHTGRHFYGRELSEEEFAARPALPQPERPAAVDPEASEPELKEGVQDPEADQQCIVQHPNGRRCELPAFHDGDHRYAGPEPERCLWRSDEGDQCVKHQGHGSDHQFEEKAAQEDDLFPQPSEEEQAAAFEAEKSSKEPVVEDPPEPGAPSSPAEPDDPWADFQ